ncbi:protein roadkill-like [Chironomus tepperi]|uniref:protein roadkill-like n=1 Tax=Chironomus tepperi TaxID=113505 RepID=UPI00391FB81C
MEPEMKVECSYYDDTYYGNKKVYVCRFYKQTIPENTTIIPDGTHKSASRGNEHVDCALFADCKLTKVPQGLTRIFPNLKVLYIQYSGLTTITKSDLAEYKNLERIYINLTSIKFLPGDLFDGFKNLEAIGFNDNKLELIEPNILDGLDNLKHVNFEDNPNYTKCYSQFKDCSPNATLEEVKDELMVKFCKEFPKTTKDLLKVKEENKNLKGKNAELNAEVKNLKDAVDDVNGKVRNLEDQVDDVNAQNQKLQSEIHKLKKSDIKNFLTDETFKDFQIQIGDHNFPVHKFLIAARSPTLAELLKNNPGVENLKLIDIPVGIFEVILKYFYTDELPGGDGMNFFHLFAAAGKLKIEELKNFAAENLLQQLDKDNALEIFKLSNKYRHDDMKKISFNRIKQNHPKINFNDELIDDFEKVVKMIEIFMKIEEMEKSIESLMMN